MPGMDYQYAFPIPPGSAPETLHWAWALTVLSHRANAGWTCEACGRVKPLDVAHVQSRKARPDLQFDPSNGLALCRSCHMKHDHLHGHRPPGRKPGTKLSEETKRRIGVGNKISHSTPEHRAATSERLRKYWDEKGRKRNPTPCAACGAMFVPRDRRARFCSSACHYSFRTGKPRSGY